jgi:hypothetical protein
MNNPHLVLYTVIAFMFFSSIVCILFVTIQNHRAVKKYYKSLQANDVPAEAVDYSFDPEDFEEITFFPKTAAATAELSNSETKDYRIAS